MRKDHRKEEEDYEEGEEEEETGICMMRERKDRGRIMKEVRIMA